MTLADVPAVLAIDLVSFHPSELGSGSQDPVALRQKQLDDELARPWASLDVARDAAGEVLGYQLYWHVLDEFHLLNVAVLPAARRRGVGRALLEHLVAVARSRNVARILLEVRTGNVPAIGLYEAFGFERSRVRKAYYADGEDGVEMYRSLET